LASFVKLKGANEHYDFIICAVYYNEKRNGISSFSSATVKELYSDAKKPLPGNLSMSLSELVKKGLIMEDPSAKGSNPKLYVLTSDGEETVQTMQPTEPKEKKSVSRPRKQRQKAESIYSGINCDDLNLENYPEVKLLKSFKEKMMLILYIVTTEGKGEWFTTADVLCLMTDIFGEAANHTQVEGVFRREKRWFKPENIDGNNKLVHRKLLNEGKSYAQSLGIVTE
jgi:DNA-binding PadR family transcriptional regulator